MIWLKLAVYVAGTGFCGDSIGCSTSEIVKWQKHRTLCYCDMAVLRAAVEQKADA